MSDMDERIERAARGGGVYIASKTKHAEHWRGWRSRGLPVISTWIDEAGPGESADLSNLWQRCISEASNCELLVCYREDGDVLKGAFIELGAALANGRDVWAFGLRGYTIANHPGIRHFDSLTGMMGELFGRFDAHLNGQETDSKVEG